MNFGGLEPVSPGRVLTVCEQLAEAGLIVFKPAPGGPDGGLVGMSKITGHGCDAVDGLAASRIALEFPQKMQSEPVPVAPAAKPVLVAASQGAQSAEAPAAATRSEVLILKPTLWGMGIDLKEVFRRVRRRWLQRKA